MTLLLLALACGEKDTVDSNADDTGTASVECEDGVCVLSGTITEDLTLTADNAWLLRGGVFIGDDESETILTIEPGTTVYGESSTDGMLVITRGSKIMAEGTAEAPIVMTSSKSEGSRARGDWGGLIINGKAPTNACGDGEEGCESYGEGGTGWYGGSDAADSSGVLKYVRVEFAGTLISPDNELNGIAFQGVGSGTEVDYVQVHMNADDGVEFFGGTVGVKHVLVTGVGDDCMDWTDGWQGKAQFVVLEQYDDAGDNGIEADNNGEDNNATPRSKPVISNLTVLGAPTSDSSDLGALLREGTAAELHNLVIAGMNDACLSVDHDATFEQIDSGELTINNSVLDCGTLYDTSTETASAEDVQAWFEAGEGNGTESVTFDGYKTGLSGGVTPSDSFFDSVDFIGAVGDEDWTAGWTTSVPN